MAKRKAGRDTVRVVYRTVYSPGRTRYIRYYKEVPVGQSPGNRQQAGKVAPNAASARNRARKQSVRKGRVLSGQSLLYRPTRVSRFGRRYLRALFDKASGGGGRGRFKRFLCGKG